MANDLGALAGADPLKGQKLAVIGAGPIGLRAALELALLGAEVPGLGKAGGAGWTSKRENSL